MFEIIPISIMVKITMENTNPAKITNILSKFFVDFTTKIIFINNKISVIGIKILCDPIVYPKIKVVCNALCIEVYVKNTVTNVDKMKIYFEIFFMKNFGINEIDTTIGRKINKVVNKSPDETSSMFTLYVSKIK